MLQDLLRRPLTSGAAMLTSVLIAASVAASAVPAQEPNQEPPGVDRVFSMKVGGIVVDAQEKLGMQPPDLEGARSDLDRALAEEPNPYELGVILYMRGGVKYRTGDSAGALSDWRRALAEGALSSDERTNLTYNIAQVEAAQ